MMAPFNAVEEQVFPLANGTAAPDLELANGTDAPDLERVAEDS